MNEVLFSSDLWQPALEKYASATHATVKLFDPELRLVFGPVNPTPLFQLFDERGFDPGLFAECARHCLGQTKDRPTVIVSKVHGLCVIGTSLVLEGKIVGAAVAGYALVDFSQVSEIQGIARDARITFGELWEVARAQKPIPQGRLIVNGELLQALGDALLRENYRTRQYEDTALALQEAKSSLEMRVKERTSELEGRNAEISAQSIQLQELSAYLMRAQDDERRKISRELHDSLGQFLAYAKMSVDALMRRGTSERETLSEVADTLEKCIAETRTISHLLHPPLLDEIGFASAARWYVEEFANRSGIAAKIAIPGELQRLPGLLELTLFRILQESLVNVHRYSESQSVDVQVQLDPNAITLEIRDYGQGMPPETLERLRNNGGAGLGVGLRSMRERISELGGQFEIQSDKNGTLVRVTVPLSAGNSNGSAIAATNRASD